MKNETSVLAGIRFPFRLKNEKFRFTRNNRATLLLATNTYVRKRAESEKYSIRMTRTKTKPSISVHSYNTCNQKVTNMAFTSKLFKLLLLVFSTLSVNGFVVPSRSTSVGSQQIPTATARSTTTALSERQWNFNEGQGPWGLKKNAETWNGRVAQVKIFLLRMFRCTVFAKLFF